MRDSRAGQALWSIWSGEGYVQSSSEEVVFGTEGNVDVENEIVRRALASAIQREGLVFSLGNGYKSVDDAVVVHGYVGFVDGDRELTKCNESGETASGDQVERASPYTWVELA